MEKIFTPEFAPYLLLIETVGMAVTTFGTYMGIRNISSSLKEYKRTREMSVAFAFVAILAGTIFMIFACLWHSMFMGFAVYLMGLGDTLAYAFWGGGSVVTVIVCIVGWQRRETAE